RDEAWVNQAREFDNICPIGVTRRDRFRDSQCDGRLPHSSRTDHADKAPFAQKGVQRGHEVVTAEDANSGDHFPVASRSCGGVYLARHRLSGCCDWRDEAIATAGNGGDVPVIAFAVAKRFTQGSDMDPETTLLDSRVGPNDIEQLPLADDFASSFGHRDKDPQGAATNPHRLIPAYQQLPRRKQVKGAK
ncbi:hypothetical protein, partial [Mesorhizobium sp. M2A.F.Ca.ET.067.02.1.1]|uniref:hypothetical protein n=1 Tax=Mesorhizobium sp. M2A.F.Ca.ET.067.02.1.1 TaxID=2496749 RepID=UPI001FE2059F